MLPERRSAIKAGRILHRIEDFITEPSLIDALVDPKNRLVMIMGASDTGKTTLVECLVDFLSRKAVVGLVDLDMGQSHIGPPTTIAWGKIFRGFKGWEEIEVEDFYFTGAVSPVGNLLPALVGARLMTDRALAATRKVVVDTTGLIAEPVGRVLKQNKIDMLSPHVVLAMERSGELGHILGAYGFHKSPRIYKISTPSGVKTKTLTKRSLYRFKKMKDYLAKAETIEVPLDDVSLRFMGEQSRITTAAIKNRMASLRDKRNRDIAVGVVKGINLKGNRINILAPPVRSGVSSIIIGRTEIDREKSMVRDKH
jgi:polynucleotide 5'-hydroxyl-kinase GRC3/NOL9